MGIGLRIMKLKAPCQGIDIHAVDIFGEPFRLSDRLGKKIILSFFRDAACPFCNYRVYELTQRYKGWKDSGVEIVTIFSDTSEQVRKHVARHPRPFTMLSDPDLDFYNQYGVDHSKFALLKALIFKLPRIIKGIAKGGRPSNNPHIDIVPADFLIDVDGQVAELWYGRDTADHIPLEKIEEFINKPIEEERSIRAELKRLQAENALLRRNSEKNT
jgi:peroxiredoxin